MPEPEITPMEAAGGVVYRFSEHEVAEVLLILRNGIWDIPKGKLEEGESIEQCAVREVAEEVGSAHPSIESKIGTTYHEYTRNGKRIGKTTHWYSMVFSDAQEFTPQKKEGITKVDWVPLEQAITRVGFENLEEILKKFSQQKKV